MTMTSKSGFGDDGFPLAAVSDNGVMIFHPVEIFV
jgi:hypothetical protein